MIDKTLTWLEDSQLQRPTAASELGELGELYSKKLWHQLTMKLDECMALSTFQADGFLIPLYRNFIATISQRLNQLSVAKIAVRVSQEFEAQEDSVVFLQEVHTSVKDAKLHLRDSEQPMLFLETHVTQNKVALGQLSEAKDEVTQQHDTLDAIQDADPCVSAAVHYTASALYKAQQDYAKFYKSTLHYLAFVSSDTLLNDFKLALAVDVSLAALLGEGVYNFGELLQHPIVRVLNGTQYEWLMEMLSAFNNGDMHAYDHLCSKHASALNAQPALVAHERELRQKITILCLTELVSNLPAEERTIPMATIAEATKLDADGVEFLLMKALSLHLLEGAINQVDGTVQVSWVQPRVLTLPQVDGLRGRLDAWITKVSAAAVSLEDESVGIIDV